MANAIHSWLWLFLSGFLTVAMAFPAFAGIDIFPWYPGSWWRVETTALISGPDVQPGTFLNATDTTTTTVSNLQTKTQTKTGLTYSCYILTTSGTSSFSGNIVAGPQVLPVRVRNAQVTGSQWIRQSDMAEVRLESHTNGRLEVYLGSQWVDFGVYEVDQYQEYDPPREGFDYPLDVNQQWRQTLTTYLWGRYNMAGVGGDSFDDTFNDTITSTCSLREQKNGVLCFKIEAAYQVLSGTVISWLSDSQRYISYAQIFNMPLGANTINESTSRLAAHSLASDPTLRLDAIAPCYLPSSQFVLTGQTGQAGKSITASFPDVPGIGPWTCVSNPQFSITITVPAVADQTVELGAFPDLGSHGLVVVAQEDTNSDGKSDHKVISVVTSETAVTATPTGNASATPAGTPTPTPVTPVITVDLVINNNYFAPGDQFHFRAILENLQAATMTADLYIVLEAFGYYYFYPSWTELLDNQIITMNPLGRRSYDILRFTWPDGVGLGGPIVFYSAVMAVDTLTLLSNVDSEYFYFYQ